MIGHTPIVHMSDGQLEVALAHAVPEACGTPLQHWRPFAYGYAPAVHAPMHGGTGHAMVSAASVCSPVQMHALPPVPHVVPPCACPLKCKLLALDRLHPVG